MRLTREDHGESLKRYRHIKPARAGLDEVCLRLCPGTTRTCSRARGHSGPHVALGRFRRILAVWDGGGAQLPVERPRGRPRRPIGLRSGAPDGVLSRVAGFLSSVVSSVEELAWVALFLAFVGFAVAGLLIIYLG